MLAQLILAFRLFSEGGEGNGGLLDVNPGLVFWMLITFLILLFILKKVAWKPILGALDEREKFIKDSLEKSEKARTDAERLLALNQENLNRAEEEAQKIIAQGRDFAEKLKSQIAEESKNEAKKIIDNASAEIKRKQDEAFETLKAQMSELAVQAAEKILRENLDKEKQLRLVNKYIDELPKN